MAEDTVDAFKFGGKPASGDQSAPVHLPNISKMSLSELSNPAVEYNMNHRRRGDCLIINQKNFDYARTGQTTRDGTEVDARNAEKAFRKLGFTVRRVDDIKVQDMMQILKDLSQKDHSDADCFACVVLSHGDKDILYGTDGRVSVDSLFYYFKGNQCLSLQGKPKFFFIQACRGCRFDPGMDAKMQPDSGEEVEVRKIPVEADVLVAYSTVPGYYAWRNNQDGSWFIQKLSQMLQEHGESVELVQLLTSVNRLVAYSFESCTDSSFSNRMKQMPSIVSMLTKLVYFRPKK